MRYVAGIDIGGTKCAVSIGKVNNEQVHIIDKIQFPTPYEPVEAVGKMVEGLAALTKKHIDKKIEAIGISCGGPLDSKKGLILSPPNLPNWDKVDVVTPFEKLFNVPVAVQNDANACALAEWIWGAGKGTENMIFLTFGTGMGAGLILNGQLYTGINDMAGEVGHIRLEDEGPEGYGKKGSFEGFCSGGGIARMAKPIVKQHLVEGGQTKICDGLDKIEELTTAHVGIAAANGDVLAQRILEKVGRKLGKGLAILIDLLNPERIVIGSIYLRQETYLRESALKVIEEEALSISSQACEILAAGLGEKVGDYAAFSVAMNILSKH